MAPVANGTKNMNVHCPERGAANHEVADLGSLCDRTLQEVPAQIKPEPKARKALVPCLMVAVGIVVGLGVGIANNLHG